ncbi:MAG: GAF domain-containing protein, partial [Microvirga sp.]
GTTDPAEPKERPTAGDARILCIAGRTELDGAAAEMVGQALVERGLTVRVLPPITVSEGALAQLNLTGVEVICLSYLHAQPQVFARYICRRLKRRSPRLKVVVGCWNAQPQAGQAEDIARQLSADAAVATIDACVNQIDAWTARRSEGETRAAPIATSEVERIEALRQLGLSSSRDPRLGAAAQRAAQVFDAPIGLVSLIDESLEPWPGPAGSSPPADAGQQTHREASICGHVAAVEEVLVAEDVALDPRFADNPLILEKGIRFYAGAPLRTASGMVLGSLCVIDTEPRAFADEDRGRLQALADELMVDLTRDAASPVRQAG